MPASTSAYRGLILSNSRIFARNGLSFGFIDRLGDEPSDIFKGVDDGIDWLNTSRICWRWDIGPL